ncbi:cache domain-containing protein [Pedobacter sp. SYSU D00535]|uniref:cache domain-containing protein n=1 Tax=Pedobacter sp. SYSU D00535 TaxID=2810308 RepID=UPI001A96AD0F|nr:cache domain-containing protein [Pedobacter sp. SYSU D00535]
MKNFFSFSRNKRIAFSTLFFVLVLAAVYLFIYVPSNVRHLEARQYRSLQNAEKNIQAKIDNSVGLLGNLLYRYRESREEYDATKVVSYIRNYSTENFKILPIKRVAGNGRGSSSDSSSAVAFSNGELLITHRKDSFEIGMSYKIEAFLRPLLSDDKFDEYLLLKKNNIVYQTFPSGATNIPTDSLRLRKSASLELDEKTIRLSGTDYKVFSQQLHISVDSLTLTGLLREKNYQYLKNKLPENITLLLLTLAIALVLFLPWIKLYQMGSKDRLTVADGAACLSVSMLLMSLLFFAFLKYNAVFRHAPENSGQPLRNLAASVQQSFQKELLAAVGALKGLDSERQRDSVLQKLSVAADTAGSLAIESRAKPLRRKLDSLEKKGVDINQVFWLDFNGNEINSWTAERQIAPPNNLSKREYFRRIIKANTYFLSDNSGQPYYLDQILSLTSGKFTSVISIPAEKQEVAVMSFNFKSLQKPVLPRGYLFSMVDKDGKVLYHSDNTKNLNENLLAEFTEPGELSTALNSGTSKLFQTRYLGKEFKVLAMPLPHLPYHLVVFEDTSFKHSRDAKNFIFSFLMLFGVFFILVLELLVVFIVSRRQSFLKKQYSDISWIGPHKCFYELYNTAILLNVVNILLLIIFYFFSSFLQFLFILLLSGAAITLALNYLYLRFYEINRPEQVVFKKRAVIALVVILLVINIAAGCLSGFGTFYAFEVLLALLSVLLLKYQQFIQGRLSRLKEKMRWRWTYTSGYSLMVFTRLIITSGIPVILFYEGVYDYELRLAARYKQAMFLQDLVETGSFSGKGEFKPATYYTDGVWVEALQNPAAADGLQDLVKKEDSLGSREEKASLSLFKTLTSLDIFDMEGRVRGAQESSSGFFRYNQLLDTAVTRTYYALGNGTYLGLKSAKMGYSLSGGVPELVLYLLIFLVALLLFWQILHRIIRKLFAQNLPREDGWETVDSVLLTDCRTNSLVFMIGAPGAGKLKKLKKLIADGVLKGKAEEGREKLLFDQEDPAGSNVKVVDMILIPANEEEAGADADWLAVQQDVFSRDYSLIIVNHFEYDIQNAATNRIKLDFLEALLQKRVRSKIFILSTVHPITFLDSLNQTELKKDESCRQPLHDLERWHVLLGHFCIVVEKLDQKDVVFEDEAPLWKKNLQLETARTHFLIRMREPLEKELGARNELDIDPDSLAFKLQTASHYFYMYIWQSLTKEEKFLLYDLAEDGLVNPYDDYNLSLLLSKGLIVREEGRLTLFNKGFRNFILTAIGAVEVMKIRQQIKDTGNWGRLKVPFMILIVGVLAFLFASQQETYSTLLTYLGILTAAVPVVLRFFTLFETTNTPKNT